MNKIKNILNPGHKVDDETLYGPDHHSSPAAGRLSADKNTIDDGRQGEQFHSTSPIAQKDKSFMNNPTGDKSDNTRFTQTAPTEAQHSAGTQSMEHAANDKGMMRQTPNPNDHQFNQTRYGTSPAPADFQPSSGQHSTDPTM